MFGLVLRTQLTRGRVLGLGALALLPVIVAVAIRADEAEDPTLAMFDLADGLGVGVIAPVVALVLASAALGDLVEDRTLVYIWLRPTPRWQLVTGALAATTLVALPLSVVPMVLAALASGAAARVAVASAAATALAVAGYAAVFLGLGLRVRRALVWGLAYLLIWEGAVARAAKGAARLSIQVYARSLLATVADHTPPRQASSGVVAVVVVVGVVVAAWAVTTRWLARAEVA